jgi:PAS domain S-box-containing protein
LSAREVLGKRPLEVFPFLREGGVIERLKRALAGESPRPVDFPFHVPLTGRTGWSSDMSAPLRSADGKIIGVIATVRDITERKKAEAALAEETARRRILFEQSPDGIVILDPQTTRFLEFNAAAHRQLGYSREEFARLSLCDVEAMETSDQVKARIAGMLGGGRADFETLHRTRQGALRNVLVTAQAMDVMGRCVYYSVWRDITQRKELELKLLHAQKMEAIGLLAGGVAHDFRNQLTVIKGYGEMLLRRSLVKDEGREKLEQILKAADRSAIISGQLLAFSRQQVLRPEVISLNSVASDIIKSLAQTLGEDIRLSVIPCGDLWNIRVDVGQFQQALLNLVLNARDAMPQGGRLTIQTENALLDESFVRRHVGVAAGRHAVVSVNDTGAGMSPQTLDRLFEPFFTTKPAGEGTGLGLAMVHGFVAQSGGFIEVHSRPGQGTTFRLYFPAVDDVAQAAQRPSPATDLSRGSGTVLVVEDEETIRRILLETLGECGYTILTAGNAREAMALTKSAKQRIDLLISDVVMPGWSGPELAKHFQAARPGVPVLLISGHTGKMLTGHGVVSPDVNLLIKPFSSQTLAQTVGRILGQPKSP